MKPLALQVSQDKWMPLSRRQRRSSLLSTEGEFLENNKASPRVVGNEYQISQASLHQTIDRGMPLPSLPTKLKEKFSC
jgi:hypothetical protein